MKTKEFQKLKQLDRIEYLLSVAQIDRSHNFFTFAFLGGFITIYFYVLIVSILMAGFFENFILMGLVLALKNTFIWMILAVFVVDVITFFRRLKKLKELEKFINETKN